MTRHALVDQLVSGVRAPTVAATLSTDPDWAAPHSVDLETLTAIQRQWRRGGLDDMSAALAIRDLQTWPARRIGHGALIPLAWAMRHLIRAADALYVTLDSRLARAVDIEVVVPG